MSALWEKGSMRRSLGRKKKQRCYCVLRGGPDNTSDLIWRELELTKRNAKPIV
jgi:hypothetical protein